MTNPIIHIDHLEKTFKVYKDNKGYFGALRNLFNRQFDIVRAVDKISFDIQQGEFVGYIGPNGAGKSTTIKMLTGLLVPTSGAVTVNGFIPWKQRKTYVKEIGVVFGQRTNLWWDLPFRDSLDLIQKIYEIPDKKFKKNLGLFREILEMDSFMNTPVRSLSLGQRMRADLCAALIHDPLLVFLDEPTIGLDVVAKEKVREFLKFINQEKQTTLLLTTHDTSDISKLCERVMIIDHGKILFDGLLNDLIQEFGGERQLVVEFDEAYPNPVLEHAAIIEHQKTKVVYQFERQTTSASTLIAKLSMQYRIRDLEIRDQPIEDTIRKIYEDQLLYNQIDDKKNSAP